MRQATGWLRRETAEGLTMSSVVMWADEEAGVEAVWDKDRGYLVQAEPRQVGNDPDVVTYGYSRTGYDEAGVVRAARRRAKAVRAARGLSPELPPIEAPVPPDGDPEAPRMG